MVSFNDLDKYLQILPRPDLRPAIACLWARRETGTPARPSPKG
jgi:hypothetical protein